MSHNIYFHTTVTSSIYYQ